MISGLLTIDDFPSENAVALVDYFHSKGIPVVFFATGENLERHFDAAVYAVRHGMIVGNHSYSHRAFSSLTLQEAIGDIHRCEQVLDRVYAVSGVKRVYRPFRFPYGDKGGANKAALQQFLRAEGFHKVDDTRLDYPWWREAGLREDVDTLWTFDFTEYMLCQEGGMTVGQIWKKMHDTNPALGAALFGPGNRHILLMHDHAATQAVLPGYYQLLTEHLLENGFVFVEPAFL